MRTTVSVPFHLIVLPLCLAVGISSAGGAADYTVTSPADSGPDSLRDIIGSLPAGSGGDGKSIGFAAGQPIALTGGPITVRNKNLAVTGQAGGLGLPGLINTIVNQQLAAAAPDAAAVGTYVQSQIIDSAGAMTSISRPGTQPGGVFTSKFGAGDGQSLADLHLHDVNATDTSADWLVGAVAGSEYVKRFNPGDPDNGKPASAELGESRRLVVNDIAVTTSSQNSVNGSVIGAGIHTGGAFNPSELTAKIGLISDSVFDGVTVKAGGQVYGGVINAFSGHVSDNYNPASPTLVAGIEGVGNTIFNDISVTTTGFSIFGGVIGAYVSSGGGCQTRTTIGEVTGSLFSNISVTTTGSGSHVYGGAVGAVYNQTGSNSPGPYTIEIGPITGSVFTGISVTTTNSGIFGGAISASGNNAPFSDPLANAVTLGSIAGSTFSDIHADAGESFAFGGAIYSTGLKEELVISGSRFLNNSVSARYAYGGAIYIDTASGLGTNHTNRLTLAAGADETTLFRGNTANGRANSIHFGDDTDKSMSHAALNIAPETGGTVALRDPLSVDMSNGKNFDMRVSGAGDFLWGGKNDIDVSGAGTVRFAAGSRTTLLPDFQLNNFGDSSLHYSGLNTGALTVNFDSGSAILVDLDSRPQGDVLAMFANRAGNAKEDFVIAGEADVVPLLLTFNQTEGRWLVVDSAIATAAADSFKILNDANSGYDAQILTDNEKIYIAIAPKAVPPDPPEPPDLPDPPDPPLPPAPVPVARLAANDNPNVIRSYLSGALEDAWQRYKADHPGDVARLAAIFDELLANPQQQIAEAIVSGANEPFRHMANLAGQAGRVDAANCAADDTGKKWRVWASGDYDRDNQFGHDNYEDYDSHRLGQVVGASYDVAPSLRLRGYAGFADGRLDSASLASRTETESYAGGLSVVWNPAPCTELELDGALGYFDNHFTRRNVVGRHMADYGQTVWQVGARGSQTFLLPAGRLTPFAGARFQRLTQDAVAETGGGWFSNRLDSLDANALYTELGFAWSQDFSLPGGILLTGSAAPSWRHDFGGREIATTGHFEGSPQRFKVAGPRRARNSFDLELEIRARILAGDDVTIDLDGGYNFNWSDRYGGHNWYSGMLISF